MKIEIIFKKIIPDIENSLFVTFKVKRLNFLSLYQFPKYDDFL